MVNIPAFIKYHPHYAALMGLGFALLAYAAYMYYQGLAIQQVKYYAIAGAVLILLPLLLYYIL